MTSFKQYFIESLQLTESPMRTGLSYEDYLDNDAMNVEEAVRTTKEFQLVASVDRPPAHLNLYQDPSGDTLMDYWLTPQPFIACYYIFKPKPDGGLQSVGVWNHRRYKATCQRLVLRLLPEKVSVYSE